MLRKTMALVLAAILIALSVSAAAGPETGLFGKLSQSEGADERLAVLEEIAEPVPVSPVQEDGFSIEISQAYYEGNRLFISYRTVGYVVIQDGLDLEEDSYADIIAGEEIEQADGSVIGWKECIVPEENAADTLTFSLVFSKSWESGEKSKITFAMERNDYSQYLQGVSPADAYQAEAELFIGKVDLTGVVRLISPDQAASWIAWQEGEDATGTDVIAGWNLYQNGEPVSFDLFGASRISGTDEVVFELMFPRMDDLSGLSLVPEYAEAGENPDEAIIFEPVLEK